MPCQEFLHGFVGEAFEDDAWGPKAKGRFDTALAFDVADVEAFTASLGGHAATVEVLGNLGEADAGGFLLGHFQYDFLLGFVGDQLADGFAGPIVRTGVAVVPTVGDGAGDQVLAALVVERGLDAFADAGAFQFGEDGGDLHEGTAHGGPGVHVDVEKDHSRAEGFKEGDGLGHIHGVASKPVHLGDNDGGAFAVS